MLCYGQRLTTQNITRKTALQNGTKHKNNSIILNFKRYYSMGTTLLYDPKSGLLRSINNPQHFNILTKLIEQCATHRLINLRSDRLRRMFFQMDFADLEFQN